MLAQGSAAFLSHPLDVSRCSSVRVKSVPVGNLAVEITHASNIKPGNPAIFTHEVRAPGTRNEKPVSDRHSFILGLGGPLYR